MRRLRRRWQPIDTIPTHGRGRRFAPLARLLQGIEQMCRPSHSRSMRGAFQSDLFYSLENIGGGSDAGGIRRLLWFRHHRDAASVAAFDATSRRTDAESGGMSNEP